MEVVLLLGEGMLGGIGDGAFGAKVGGEGVQGGAAGGAGGVSLGACGQGGRGHCAWREIGRLLVCSIVQVVELV